MDSRRAKKGLAAPFWTFPAGAPPAFAAVEQTRSRAVEQWERSPAGLRRGRGGSPTPVQRFRAGESPPPDHNFPPRGEGEERLQIPALREWGKRNGQLQRGMSIIFAKVCPRVRVHLSGNSGVSPRWRTIWLRFVRIRFGCGRGGYLTFADTVPRVAHGSARLFLRCTKCQLFSDGNPKGPTQWPPGPPEGAPAGEAVVPAGTKSPAPAARASCTKLAFSE